MTRSTVPYQACYECGATFTEAGLLGEHNALVMENGTNTVAEWTDPFAVWSCPRCLHDFPYPPVTTTLTRQFGDARPGIVCLCGSTRFYDTFREQNLRLTLAGLIVLSIGCDTKSDTDLAAVLGELTDARFRLDELHKRKIDLCDWVLVLDVDGYIGESTRSEIDYATRLGRPVHYLSEESGWTL